jgi:TonB family protein
MLVIALAAAGALSDAARAGDSSDRAPVVYEQARPVYPYSLRLSGNRGEVVVDFIVDTEGSVRNPTVIKSSHPDFEAPAVEAVLQWKFKPGLKGGHPVFVHMQVPIIFQLLGSEEDHIHHLDDMRGREVWGIPASAPKSFPDQLRYDEPPKPLVTSAPVYPFDLLEQNVKGKVSVSFTIDPAGQTHVIKVENADRPEFAAAASAMIAAWTFQPAMKGGKPGWALLRKSVEFNRDADDFPMNESAERLLKAIRRNPCPILVNAAELDAPLKGRFQPSPVVPDAVLKANTRAEAIVEFVVDHAGHAQLPRIISATDPEFGWAAATAVARWQYTVPSLKGKTVDVFVRVPLVFAPAIAAPKGA